MDLQSEINMVDLKLFRGGCVTRHGWVTRHGFIMVVGDTPTTEAFMRLRAYPL